MRWSKTSKSKRSLIIIDHESSGFGKWTDGRTDTTRIVSVFIILLHLSIFKKQESTKPMSGNHMKSLSAPTSMQISRSGKLPNVVVATVLSCGLGGFRCAEGGPSPLCYMRCCRVDIETLNPCVACCTCCFCCCGWPFWAFLVHKRLSVDFYDEAFFQ